jgi:hypothetical protein
MRAPDPGWLRPPDRRWPERDPQPYGLDDATTHDSRLGRDSPPHGRAEAATHPSRLRRDSPRDPPRLGAATIARPPSFSDVVSSRPEEDAPLVSAAYAQGSCYGTNRVVTGAPGRLAGPAAPPPSTAREAESTGHTLRRPRSSRSTNWARIPEEPDAAGSSRKNRTPRAAPAPGTVGGYARRWWLRLGGRCGGSIPAGTVSRALRPAPRRTRRSLRAG